MDLYQCVETMAQELARVQADLQQYGPLLQALDAGEAVGRTSQSWYEVAGERVAQLLDEHITLDKTELATAVNRLALNIAGGCERLKYYGTYAHELCAAASNPPPASPPA